MHDGSRCRNTEDSVIARLVKEIAAFSAPMAVGSNGRPRYGRLRHWPDVVCTSPGGRAVGEPAYRRGSSSCFVPRWTMGPGT